MDESEAEARGLAALVGEIGAGKRDAFERLYLQFGGRLYGTALNLLRSPDAAEAVVRDVLADLWLKPQAFAGTDGVVAKRLLAEIRQQSLKRLYSLPSATRDVPLSPALLERVAAICADLQARPPDDRADPFTRALMRLDPLDRKLFVAASVFAASYESLARSFALPAEEVRTRIRQALAQLEGAVDD